MRYLRIVFSCNSINLVSDEFRMDRTGSLVKVSSFTSDQLDNEEHESLTFDVAPFDIIGNHESVGDVIVAKEDTPLPYTSKYFKKDGGTHAVKFSVDKNLDVSICNVREIKKATTGATIEIQPNSSYLNKTPIVSIFGPSKCAGAEVSTNQISSKEKDMTSTSSNTLAVETASMPPPVDSADLNVELSDSTEVVNEVDLQMSNTEEPSSSKRKRFRGIREFVTNLDKHFEEIVIGGLDSGLRKSVHDRFMRKEKLLPTENMNIIYSLNQAYYDEYGDIKPDRDSCQLLGDLLKDKFPTTFRKRDAVKTAFGTLQIKGAKGEGGNADIERRIGDAFYDKYIRKNSKKSKFDTDASSAAVQKKKSPKKLYCLDASKWDLDITVSKLEMKLAKEALKRLETNISDEEKIQSLLTAAPFIQSQIKSLQPSQAVESLRVLLTDGHLLSSCFEYMVTDGSVDGSLASTAELQMTKVMNLVEQYLIEKRGNSFEEIIGEVKANSARRCGNDIDVKIFLIRELGKQFKNSSHFLLYLDGEDDDINGPNDQQPNIFITRQNTFGMEEYEEKVDISVRIGRKVLLSHVPLSGAIAACIELYFIFNLLYPKEAEFS